MQPITSTIMNVSSQPIRLVFFSPYKDNSIFSNPITVQFLIFPSHLALLKEEFMLCLPMSERIVCLWEKTPTLANLIWKKYIKWYMITSRTEAESTRCQTEWCSPKFHLQFYAAIGLALANSLFMLEIHFISGGGTESPMHYFLTVSIFLLQQQF